jgi:hypothetical protein
MRIVAVASVFAIAFAVRWATLGGLAGDDHWSLWTAATFLKGDRPFRDFVDLGDPLYWGMSALAQVITGYRVVGEVALGAALVALAFAIAFHLAWRASGSLLVAAGLTALALLVVTERELYSYPKIFVYPLGIWLCWRYIDRPTLLRSVVLAAGVAVAWGYRHDHGVYVGAGAAAAVLAAHWSEGPRRVVAGWLRFGVVLLLLLSPYLALVQAYEGIIPYVQSRMQLARTMDTSSRRSVSFSAAADAPARWVSVEPPPPARVIVDWTPEVTSAARAAIEKQYSLTNGREYDVVDTRRKWEYALTNVSIDNVRAIVEDPRVYDTGLIDRETYRPLEEPWFVGVQRSIPLFRVSIAPRYLHAQNAGVVLHYISFALPGIILIMLAADRARGRRRGPVVSGPEKMFAAAVMMGIAYFALLRREGYFADHAAATAILGACVSAEACAGSRVSRVMGAAALVISVFAALSYANVPGSIARMDTGLRGIWNEKIRAFQAYTTSPPIDAYAPRGTTGDRGLIRYIYECTRPDDRVWLLTDLFTFPYYAERPVVGHIYWQAGLLTSPAYQRTTIEHVDKEEVPLIIALGGQRPMQFLEAYPLVHQYVAQRYTTHYTVPEESGRPGTMFWLLTDSRRRPTGTYELLGLPCFK